MSDSVIRRKIVYIVYELLFGFSSAASAVSDSMIKRKIVYTVFELLFGI